jgi:protein-disulfide isomerase
MKVSKQMLVGVVVVLVAAFVLGSTWYRGRQAATAGNVVATGTATGAELVRPYSITLGPASAPVTMVEFFDPECEACRAMYPIVKQVMAEFDGQVRLVIRYMPLHQNSAYAATVLEAARAQNKYWEYLEVVMLRQPEWASHAAPRPDLLMTYAPMAGLDVEQLRLAMTDPEIKTRIQQDQADGLALGANRTPTFFINGTMLMQLGYAPLRAAIERELE